MGIQYSDFLQMDIRQFNNYYDGYIDRREIELNDEQFMIKIAANQIALALHNSKKFNRPMKPIKLRAESRAARMARTLNELGVKRSELADFMARKERKKLDKRK